jgi:hypothetical protein
MRVVFGNLKIERLEPPAKYLEFLPAGEEGGNIQEYF